MAFARTESGAAASLEAAHEHSLSVHGMRMHYRILGDGSPLELLHHFGGCGSTWQPHLARLARGDRLIVPDLRGHGRSANPLGEFTHRQAAYDLFALLDHLGIQRFQAMGMSSGGMTLHHMASQQPHRLEAMVLIGATTHFPEQARDIMRHGIPDRLSAAERAEWGRCSSRGEPQRLEILAQFHRMKDRYNDMNFTAAKLPTIRARTLIVHGDRDEFFPIDIAGAQAPLVQQEVLAFLGSDWPQR